jgi:hypothetical protein
VSTSSVGGLQINSIFSSISTRVTQPVSWFSNL